MIMQKKYIPWRLTMSLLPKYPDGQQYIDIFNLRSLG